MVSGGTGVSPVTAWTGETPVPPAIRHPLPDRESVAGQRVAPVAPVAVAAVHGVDLAVTHLLHVVRRQGRAKAAAAVQHDLGVLLRHAGLDVALDDPLAQ